MMVFVTLAALYVTLHFRAHPANGAGCDSVTLDSGVFMYMRRRARKIIYLVSYCNRIAEPALSVDSACYTYLIGFGGLVSFLGMEASHG